MAERRFSFTWHPEEHERIAPGAFDKVIGQPTRYRLPSGQTWPATVAGAEVAADGRSVLFTVDVQVPDEIRPSIRPATLQFGLGAARPSTLGPAWAELWERLGLDEEGRP